MSSQLSGFDESGAKAGYAVRELLVAVLLVALPIFAVAAFLFAGGGDDASDPVVAPIDSAMPVDLSAARWHEATKTIEQSDLQMSDGAASEAVARPSDKSEQYWLEPGFYFPDGSELQESITGSSAGSAALQPRSESPAAYEGDGSQEEMYGIDWIQHDLMAQPR